MIDFLFTSALFGRVVANNASVAGATGGCRSRSGFGICNAAAAAVSIFNGRQNNQDMPWHWQCNIRLSLRSSCWFS